MIRERGVRPRCAICGREYEEPVQRCECGGPVEFGVFRGVPRDGDVWRGFRDFWPVEPDYRLSLGEGNTPLLRSVLGSRLGVELYLKNESVNPTWSFKDRGTFLAMSYVARAGYRAVGTVSTGNMAVSVAAYASRAGLAAKIFVSENVNAEKLKAVSVYGVDVVRVRGDYGRLYFESLKLGERYGVYFINSDNPFRVEGYKGISFEISREVTPDYVLIPSSSGGLFRGVAKGFIELKESGIIDRLPTLVAVQAEGCSPICRAFKEGWDRVKPFGSPKTVAKAISNPSPPSGDAVLRLLRMFGWRCETVSDEEILEAQRELAREGLFVEPASAASVAALMKMRKEGIIPEGVKAVAILTGAGLKTLDQVPEPQIEDCSLEDLEKCFEI